MKKVPTPSSTTAAHALALIGEHVGRSPQPLRPKTLDAYRQWGRIVGTHLRPGHRSGIASRAEAFSTKTPPPKGENLSINYDQLHAKKTGKSWRVPYVRFQSPDFSIDYTLVKAAPHWRIRFTGRTRGRAATSQKIALLQFLDTAALPCSSKGRLTHWFPCPQHFLAQAHPYVRKFLRELKAE